jgi:glutamyl-tRNA synthetase
MTVRVRFAPSPTGHLHVGGARTALFNWLFARKSEGVFVLRIEDTDRERSSDAMTEAILHALRWLGLDWDEGPFFQSQGLSRHQADAQRLLESALAYRDFSTPEEVARDREALIRAGRGYRPARDRADALGPEEETRRVEAGVPYAIRFRVRPGETVWEDLVHGITRFNNEDIDDLTILRSDGTPTYNLAVVSDDAEMGITHVIRGDDHLSNTPKQILLYQALGKSVPVFGHVPMILGPDGKRLSKRHGATSIAEYEDQGILPGAMVNFLALLGWNPGDEQEIFELPEIVERFTVERILKKSSVFDLEKLSWLTGRHLSRTPASRLEPLVTERFARSGKTSPEALTGRMDWYLGLIGLLKERARSLDDIVEQGMAYVLHEVVYEEAAVSKHWKDPQWASAALDRLGERLSGCPWLPEDLESELRGLAADLGVGAGRLIHPLRVALTGQAVSPGIFDVMVLLGRERTLGRIGRAVSAMRSKGKG